MTCRTRAILDLLFLHEIIGTLTPIKYIYCNTLGGR